MPDIKSTSTHNQIGAAIGSDPYGSYTSALKWVLETQRKLPNISQDIREEAFDSDPLVKGIIYPYLKNYLLSGGSFETQDNKLYVDAIDEINDYVERIGLLDAFRKDFKYLFFLKGHSYRRIDRNRQGKIEFLTKIRSSQVTQYIDPWNERFVSYHQSIMVPESWQENTSEKKYDCWWIPDVLPGKAWVSGPGPKDEGVLEKFNELTKQYSIYAKENVRIGSSDDILAMHIDDVDDTSAPIDSVVLAIWLKRLLLVNSPNMIFRVLSPILQLKKGIVVESVDSMGNKTLITSVPSKPDVAMATTDPEGYNQMAQEYTDYQTALRTGMDNVISCLKDGGVYGSAPDEELIVVESGREVSATFIKETIALLNEEIGQCFGFPIALVTASGSELATSRTIESTLSKTFNGARLDYEKVANWIISQEFAGRSWNGYKYEDIDGGYKLETPGTKDMLVEAQTKLALTDSLLKIKELGASLKDMQALVDEYMDMGDMELSNYERKEPEPVEDNNNIHQQFQSQNNELKSSMPDMKNDDLKPSNFDEEELKKDLLKAYEAAQSSIKQLIEDGE
jgi:hypothetical protein